MKKQIDPYLEFVKTRANYLNSYEYLVEHKRVCTEKLRNDCVDDFMKDIYKDELLETERKLSKIREFQCKAKYTMDLISQSILGNKTKN